MKVALAVVVACLLRRVLGKIRPGLQCFCPVTGSLTEHFIKGCFCIMKLLAGGKSISVQTIDISSGSFFDNGLRWLSYIAVYNMRLLYLKSDLTGSLGHQNTVSFQKKMHQYIKLYLVFT